MHHPTFTITLQSAGGTIYRASVTATGQARAMAAALKLAAFDYPDSDGWRPVRIERL